MINIKNGSIQNSPCHIGRIDAIAYDGYDFSLLTPNQKTISKLDQQLCLLSTISTCRKYHCLCFDNHHHCYWAMSAQRPCTLFMLDENFCEIETLKLPSTNSKQPCAISCSPCLEVLMILYTNTIVYVNIGSRGYRCVPIEDCDMQVFDILSLPHGYVLAYLQNHQFYIEVNCSEFGSPAPFCIPDGFRLEGMYLCDIQPSTNCSSFDINLILCESRNHKQCILPLLITCGNEECECHENVSSCECGIYEILHSIALEEAGLAHILNAEGEKIQKAIADNASIEELLNINASVSNTISKVTILEGQLIAKLENVLCFCENEDTCRYTSECETCSHE